MTKALGDQSYTKTKIISLVKSFLKFLGVNGKLCKSVDTTIKVYTMVNCNKWIGLSVNQLLINCFTVLLYPTLNWCGRPSWEKEHFVFGIY